MQVTFVKGVSGNPSGRPKTRELSDALRKLLREKGPGGQVTNRRLIAENLMHLATTGNALSVQAARLILEYTEGKPPQPLEHTGADGAPLSIKHEFDYAAYSAAFAQFASGRAAERTLAGADDPAESLDSPYADDSAGVLPDGPAA